MRKSNVPGVEKSERDEKRKMEGEQKKAEVIQNKAPEKIYLETLKDKKILFERQLILEREMEIIVKDIQLMKVQMKDLMEVLNEALNLIESEEERNKKFEGDKEEPEEEKTVEEKLKEHQEKELQKVSLFKRA